MFTTKRYRIDRASRSPLVRAERLALLSVCEGAGSFKDIFRQGDSIAYLQEHYDRVADKRHAFFVRLARAGWRVMGDDNNCDRIGGCYPPGVTMVNSLSQPCGRQMACVYCWIRDYIGRPLRRAVDVLFERCKGKFVRLPRWEGYVLVELVTERTYGEEALTAIDVLDAVRGAQLYSRHSIERESSDVFGGAHVLSLRPRGDTVVLRKSMVMLCDPDFRVQTDGKIVRHNRYEEFSVNDVADIYRRTGSWCSGWWNLPPKLAVYALDLSKRLHMLSTFGCFRARSKRGAYAYR